MVFCSLLQGEVEDKFRFTTFILQYATYLVQFVLAMFPEPQSHLAHQEDEVCVCSCIGVWTHFCMFVVFRESHVLKEMPLFSQESHGGG